MRKFEPMFGFDENDIRNLHNTCWVKHGASCGEWESFEAFAKWASENGYRKLLVIRAIDDSLPMGPENAVFTTVNGNRASGSEKKTDDRMEVSPCEGCKRAKTCEKPCLKRYEWWDVGMEKVRKHFGIL